MSTENDPIAPLSENDPIAPLSKLGRRLADEAKKLGLHMVTFSLSPDPNGTDHVVHAAFIPVDDDAPQVTGDEEFDALIRAQERHEQEERAKKAREELEQFRKNLEDDGGSFL